MFQVFLPGNSINGLSRIRFPTRVFWKFRLPCKISRQVSAPNCFGVVFAVIFAYKPDLVWAHWISEQSDKAVPGAIRRRAKWERQRDIAARIAVCRAENRVHRVTRASDRGAYLCKSAREWDPPVDHSDSPTPLCTSDSGLFQQTSLVYVPSKGNIPLNIPWNTLLRGDYW